MTAASPVLSLANIRNVFRGVIAVQDFSLELSVGEIVALVAEIGAGTSMLVKVISGRNCATLGDIRSDGESVALFDSSAARSQGIEAVYQDLALAHEQTLYTNKFLGRELTKKPFGLLEKARIRKESQMPVDDLDARITSADSTIHDFAGGRRQRVAIARVTHWANKLVPLDEPAAALGVSEIIKVEELVASLKLRYLAILLISHSLDQVFRLADRIRVLRCGNKIVIRKTAETDRNEILSMNNGVHV